MPTGLSFDRFRKGTRDRWTGYVLETGSGGLYVGSTSDPDRRFREHANNKLGSLWVARHGGAKRIIELFFCGTKEQARDWEKKECQKITTQFPLREVYVTSYGKGQEFYIRRNTVE